jgi:NAD+ synthase
MTGDELGCRMGQVEQMIRYAYWNSGCTGIVVGVSGGVDSALAAAFSCRAIGPERVLGLCLPSSISAPQDAQDAQELCAGLGMEHRTISIEPVLDAFRAMPGFVPSPYLLGNLMARIRMSVLYYHANAEHRLGYCTKFGDNAADIQPLLHLYKTEVYVIAREINIPDQILQKAPSAGLWAGQSDEGEIGLSYREIDASLQRLENNRWKASGPTDEKVLALVQKSEHKRLGAPSLSGAPKGSRYTVPDD